jgi:hypothetical protein
MVVQDMIYQAALNRRCSYQSIRDILPVMYLAYIKDTCL